MYTEENLKEEKPFNLIEKKKAITIVAVFLIAMIMVITSIRLLTNHERIPNVVVSNKEWTSEAVILTVKEKDTVSYSFDGGKSWQAENFTEVTSNQDIIVVVKYENEKLSRKTTIKVNNIDKEGPIISFSDPFYIQLNSVPDLKSGVTVTDEGSGSRDFKVEPKTIDTSISGEHKVKYIAFDNLGNSSEKTRTVIVKNLITKTLYRSRPVTRIENYQCDPYDCKCVSCLNAIVRPTRGCPTGYTLSGNNCVANLVASLNASCPSGYRLENGMCNRYIEPRKQNNCIPGFTARDSQCMIDENPRTTTTTYQSTKCPSGFTRNGDNCIRNYNVSYMYNCEGVGTFNSNRRMCRTDIIYACSSHEYNILRGTRCFDQNNISISAVATCPVGFKVEGNACLREAKKICPTGSVENKNKTGCIQTITLPAKARGTSVSYNFCNNNRTALINGRCRASYQLLITNVCNNGFTLVGEMCRFNTSKAPRTNCPSGYSRTGNNCTRRDSIPLQNICPANFRLDGLLCRSTRTEGTCCSTCYKTCKKETYGEWSPWTEDKIIPNSRLQVETKVE